MNEYQDMKIINALRERGDYNAFHMGPLLVSEDVQATAADRISWASVFSGMMIALVTQFIFNLLGIGLTITGKEYGISETSAVALTTGEICWWMAAGIVSAGIGGFAAGRLSGSQRRTLRAWHGLTAWAVSAFVLALLVMSGAGVVMGGILNVTGLSTSLFMNSAYAISPVAIEGMTMSEAVEASKSARSAITEGALIYGATLFLSAFAALFGGMAGSVRSVVSIRHVGKKKLH